MTQDWKELTEITRGTAVEIERIRIKKSGVAIEGSFELPPLAQLTLEEQIFITAFIRCEGSIKDMEELFGISYPTVKTDSRGSPGSLNLLRSIPLLQELRY